MKYLNSRLLTLAVMIGFLALCWYAYPRPASYTTGQIKALDRLIAKSARPDNVMKYRAQLAILFHTDPEEK